MHEIIRYSQQYSDFFYGYSLYDSFNLKFFSKLASKFMAKNIKQVACLSSSSIVFGTAIMMRSKTIESLVCIIKENEICHVAGKIRTRTYSPDKVCFVDDLIETGKTVERAYNHVKFEHALFCVMSETVEKKIRNSEILNNLPDLNIHLLFKL